MPPPNWLCRWCLETPVPGELVEAPEANWETSSSELLPAFVPRPTCDGFPFVPERAVFGPSSSPVAEFVFTMPRFESACSFGFIEGEALVPEAAGDSPASEGKSGTTTCASGFAVQMIRINWINNNTPSPMETIFMICSGLSRMARLLDFPLRKIQNRDGHFDFDVAGLRWVGSQLD